MFFTGCVGYGAWDFASSIRPHRPRCTNGAHAHPAHPHDAPQPPGQPGPTVGAFGHRQDKDPRAYDTRVPRMLTRRTHHPVAVENSMFHGTRRFSRGPRRMLQVRTSSASIALSTDRGPLPSDPNAPLPPSERTPLPSPSPRQSPINFVVSITDTHINRTQALHYEK